MLKILLPTDGSEQSLQAVHHALRLVGAGLKARFVVANVQETATLYEMVVAHDPAVLEKVNEEAGLDLMRPAMALMEAAGLAVVQEVATGDPAQMLVLSRDPSAFSGEHLFAVTADVPGEEMTTLSGDFLTKTFEGPYSQVRNWHSLMQSAAREVGREPGQVWFYYTTCPNCAKAYGRNPVVGVVELIAR